MCILQNVYIIIMHIQQSAHVRIGGGLRLIGPIVCMEILERKLIFLAHKIWRSFFFAAANAVGILHFYAWQTLSILRN